MVRRGWDGILLANSLQKLSDEARSSSPGREGIRLNTKQLQAVYKRYGEILYYGTEPYVLKHKLLCPGIYKFWLILD